MKKFLQKHRSWFLVLFQALLVFCSFVGAWLLRFDFTLQNTSLLLSAAPILILMRLLAIAYFRLLHGWWRYAGVSDALNLAKAIAAGSIAFWVTMRFVLEMQSFPRSVYVLETLLSMGLP